MVVLPTEEEVVLTYGRTGVDVLSIFLSFIGLVLLLVLKFQPEIQIEASAGSRTDELLDKWSKGNNNEEVPDHPEGSI